MAAAQATLQTTVLVLSVLFCRAIHVPVVWGDDSEVRQVETFTAVTPQRTIPQEYFEYKAKKPQLAVDVAAFHGVKDPKQYYKPYPIRPYTGKEKPELGKHHMLDDNKDIYHQYQRYVNGNDEWQREIIPTASNYEVFHPYKAEERALQELYKDPILDKIRNDLKDSESAVLKYENEAGESDIQEGEYLESPEQTDRKKIPQINVPVAFEIHRPLRRPVYYRPPPKAFTREQILNEKFRHPWYQNFVKVRPLHYRPLKNHLHNLRQHHAFRYDDEHNEYPQVPPSENYAESPDGYDIYLKGQAKYNQLRNNLDESINKAVLKNRPSEYQKLELQNQDTNEESDENEFVPIKNYAQVRKSETTKHLPKSAALEDAISYDDIVNAHRLREAVKSTKAQTVYTEEGYEDAAYDHAGEQKHASDHEGHGGFLKEKEISGGKFKTPSFSGRYEDASGSVYRDKKHHGKKWANDDKDKEKQIDSDDYSEDEHEHSEEEDAYGNVPDEEVRHKREHDGEMIEGKDNTNEDTSKNTDEDPNDNEDAKNISNDEETRQKRDNKPENNAIQSLNISSEHDLNKREANFEVPDIDFDSTFLTEKELNKMAKLKLPKAEKSNLQDKYPYYFTKLKSIHKDSPLRYAENLKLIPLKSQGGTEFYDSRSNIECSEVDDDINPIPEKIKNNGTQTSTKDEDNENKGSDKIKFDNIKKKQRLGGLGDKIDCFKAKYFGENPLDSPFFKEQLIANPEPLKKPKLETFNLDNYKKSSLINAKGDNLQESSDFIALHDQLTNGTAKLQDSLAKAREELKSYLLHAKNSPFSNNTQQTNVYGDIFDTIKTNFQAPLVNDNTTLLKSKKNYSNDPTQPTHHDVTVLKRKKRATPFVYEPYKIIREGQAQESKKTTTTGNISPLIKQLQSSKVVEKVLSFNHDKDQPVKRNVKNRTYKDISRKDREKNEKREDSGFVDVNIDQRRGEPRYELKLANHKSQYTPVDHKKAMSLEDYETQTNTTITPSRYRKAMKSKYDESVTPQTSLESAASKTVRRIVSTTVPPKEVIKKNMKSTITEESGEDYDDYEDDEEEITTTTTTVKPSFRRRNKPISTTLKPQDDYNNKEHEEEIRKLPKLRLVTRFNEPNVAENTKIRKEEAIQKQISPVIDEDDDINTPKYREKKKKTRKSTLVTDTKRYGGNDDDDMRKEEVDALIGVKQNMKDYMPNYEKQYDDVTDMIKKQVPESSEEEEDEDSEENDDDEDDDEDEEDDGEDEEDDDNDDDDEDEPEDEHVEETKIENENGPIIVTTPEPTKRTLLRTTEAPSSTTEARSAKLAIKPVVHRKQVEIHSELPVNLTAPHVTQFKQDIKEVEIIKEMPHRRRKPVKTSEALNLFKDENLAEEINKLKEVEVFKENLDLKQGPRHGGNYRMADELLASLQSSTPTPIKKRRPVKTSSDTKPHREVLSVDEDIEVKNARSVKGRKNKQPNDNEASNAKHIELSESDQPRALHGGNLKSIQDKLKSRENNRNAKLIELDEEYENDDDSGEMHGDNFKSHDSSRTKGGLHGGNYRSAKLIQAENPNDTSEKDQETLQARSKHAKGNRNNAAVLLNGFAKAVPILTTTPNYIVDPSKRMYYYVDT